MSVTNTGNIVEMIANAIMEEDVSDNDFAKLLRIADGIVEDSLVEPDRLSKALNPTFGRIKYNAWLDESDSEKPPNKKEVLAFVNGYLTYMFAEV